MTPVSRTEASLTASEEQLAAAVQRRDALTADLQRVSARADAGGKDGKAARLELAPLNKALLAAGRLVQSLQRQVAEAKKWRGMAVAQAANAARLAVVAADAGLPRDRVFEVRAPDGRVLQHLHHSHEALRTALLPGYTVAGEVFGADEQGRGGFSVAAGHDLIAFLAAHGVKVSSPAKDNAA